MFWTWLVGWICAAASSWHHVRLGPPLLDLRDHTLSAFNNIGLPMPSASDSRPAEMAIVEQMMAQAVSQNGLRLDLETASNGDCGPDAVLRNILRLQLQGQRARQIARHFQQHGREGALQALRYMLLIWLRDHAHVEIVPGTTIEAWVCMGEYASLEAYIAAMRQPRTWIDTPMLVAASAVFDMQFVIFVGRGEPE